MGSCIVAVADDRHDDGGVVVVIDGALVALCGMLLLSLLMAAVAIVMVLVVALVARLFLVLFSLQVVVFLGFEDDAPLQPPPEPLSSRLDRVGDTYSPPNHHLRRLRRSLLTFLSTSTCVSSTSILVLVRLLLLFQVLELRKTLGAAGAQKVLMVS